MATTKKDRYIKVTEQITKLPVAPGLQMMYAEILHLSEGKGYCYANNKHFENLFKKSDSCISKWVKTLEKKELVYRLVIRSSMGTERRLYLNKLKYLEAQKEHTEQTLTGRQNTQPGLAESATGEYKHTTRGCTK
ncbi:hypothetical protein GCM10028895_26280 [Pontibacter rugosus]